MPSLLNNAKHWRSRAEEAQAVAGQMNETAAKRIMLEIAREYERLARMAEARNEATAGNEPRKVSRS